MAFEDKSRPLPAAGQAPASEVLREMVSMVAQDAIRAAFERFLGAAPYERTPAHRGHRNGSYPRTLKTRVGAMVLDVPRDRAGARGRRTRRAGAPRGACGPPLRPAALFPRCGPPTLQVHYLRNALSKVSSDFQRDPGPCSSAKSGSRDRA